eukprot:Unigene18222_Nuclearia_a/m.52643 Unigene18222_Nuclearia_a/g.52643  ORF Unigene18222_Nuclearia_a/g.52643 Unigene18222_Nuclearia_a/m.52643 type:complete len:143 (+) Unigene18222_Nuclearia_a:324-752(+)
MPFRPKIEFLPDEVRAQLDSRIRAARYGSYEACSRWLATLGYAISKTSIGKYGAALREADKVGGATAGLPAAGGLDRAWCRLPAHVRRELADRLVAGGWDDHGENAAWLRKRGYPIGAAAVEAFARDLSAAIAMRDAMALLD